MKNEEIIQSSTVSAKRYLWYLLILGGAAIFGLYLLYSMSCYQSEIYKYTAQELFRRSLSSDGGLPFVALIIPVTGVVAYFIVRTLGKLEVVVTTGRIHGRFPTGAAFDIPRDKIKRVEKAARTTLKITTTNGTITVLRGLGNCDDLYVALKGELPPVCSRAAYRKLARIAELQKLSDHVLLTRASFLQAARNITYTILALLALGCSALSIIDFFKYGFDYAIIYPVFFLGIFLIFSIPLFYVIITSKAIHEVIDLRAEKSPKLKSWKTSLADKRRKATIILVTIIAVCSLVPSIILFSDMGNGNESNGMVICSSCNHTFKSSSNDARSIAKRKMCERCYKNMTSTQDALDKWYEEKK